MLEDVREGIEIGLKLDEIIWVVLQVVWQIEAKNNSGLCMV
jgi:hypothetical protein